jgi:photosystem II stability/assembly factor-like uncharacterized protein
MARHIRSVRTLLAAGAVCLVAAACGGHRLTLAELEDPGWTPPTTATLAPTVGSLSTTVPPSSDAPSDPAGDAPSDPSSPATTVAQGAWTPAAANLVNTASHCGDISLMAARPDSDFVVTSVAQSALWGSMNGATNWTELGQGAGSASVINRGSSIVFDPSHPGTFWESGIYFGGGIYRTDDNGTTMQALGNINHIDTVSVDLSDPGRQTLLAGRHESTQLFRSTDGGKTWNDISKSLPPDVGFVTGPFVMNSQTYLLGTNHGSASGIFRTTDGGATWTKVFAGATDGVVLASKADQTLYWIIDSGGIVKSTDGGLTWSLAARPGSVNILAPSLLELPDGSLAAIGNQYVIASSDKGATWQRVGPALPLPPSGVAYSAGRHTFYVWSSQCGGNPGDPIKDNNIVAFTTS